MSRFTPPIRRKDTARGHHYVDANGNRVPGVTSILSDGLPKAALINWAANATADAAVNLWDELATLPPAARLKRLQGARYEEKDRAAKRGTEVHRFGEDLIHGRQVQAPDEIAGHVEAYARFLDEFRVTPVHVEFSVASARWGYAGTGDLIADLETSAGTVRALIDLKTNRSGIFGEVALQTAAYRFAETLVTGTGRDQTDQPMPAVDACFAVHVRADGYSLIPLTVTEEVFKVFLYAMQIAQWSKVDRDFVGPALVPPNTSTYRLVRDDA